MRVRGPWGPAGLPSEGTRSLPQLEPTLGGEAPRPRKHSKPGWSRAPRASGLRTPPVLPTLGAGTGAGSPEPRAPRGRSWAAPGAVPSDRLATCAARQVWARTGGAPLPAPRGHGSGCPWPGSRDRQRERPGVPAGSLGFLFGVPQTRESTGSGGDARRPPRFPFGATTVRKPGCSGGGAPESLRLPFEVPRKAQSGSGGRGAPGLPQVAVRGPPTPQGPHSRSPRTKSREGAAGAPGPPRLRAPVQSPRREVAATPGPESAPGRRDLDGAAPGGGV